MSHSKLHSRKRESQLYEAVGEPVNKNAGTHHSSPAESHLSQFQLGNRVPASPWDTRIETQGCVYPSAAIEISNEEVLIT